MTAVTAVTAVTAARCQHANLSIPVTVVLVSPDAGSRAIGAIAWSVSSRAASGSSVASCTIFTPVEVRTTPLTFNPASPSRHDASQRGSKSHGPSTFRRAGLKPQVARAKSESPFCLPLPKIVSQLAPRRKGRNSAGPGSSYEPVGMKLTTECDTTWSGWGISHHFRDH